MAFNIDDLRRQVMSPFMKPVANPAYFEAFFTQLPRCMTPEPKGPKLFGVDVVGLATEKILGPSPFTNVQFRVQTADLPQRQFEVMSRQTHGPKRDIAIGHMYATSSIEVIENDQYDMRNFFDTWMDKIQHAGFTDSETLKKQSRFYLEFYDNYISEFTIIAFASNGLPQRKWILKECYPISVNASNMSWSSQNTYTVVPVELTFREWEVKELNMTDMFSDPDYMRLAASGALNTVSSMF